MVIKGRFLKFCDVDGFVSLVSIEQITSISYDDDMILIRDSQMTHLVPYQHDYIEFINKQLVYYQFDE